MSAADRARETIDRLRADPAFFCREVLGVAPWAKQIEILEALRDHDRVAVRSGHGTGKSFISAAAALWFLYAFHPAKVVTTAPTWAQVRLILWSEMRRLHAGATLALGGKVLEERIKVGDDAFAVGLSTDEAERFQGFHAEHVLVILDEAPGVRAEIWHAAETLLTGRVGKLLAIGNPTRPAGLFYECFRPASGWRTVHISCLDSPNVRAAADGEGGSGAAAGDSPAPDGKNGFDPHPRDGSAPAPVPAEPAEPAAAHAARAPDGTPYPRLVTPRWIAARAAEWGTESPLYRARVLGEFPEDEASVLVPRAWLERASTPVPPEHAPGMPGMPGAPDPPGTPAAVPTLDAPGMSAGAWRLGVDVARQGADRTVFALVDDRGLRAMESHRGWDTMRTAGRVAQLLRTLPGLSASGVAVDDTGLGAGVTDRLREQGHAVTAVLASSRADDPKRFANRRAECYWRLREALRPPGTFALPPAAPDASAGPSASAELLRELGALTFSLESNGTIRIADKVALRGALGGSPDHADALALAFAADGGADLNVVIW